MNRISLSDLASDGLISPDALSRLQPYLSRVEKGYDVDVRTPFWNGQSRESVISAWKDLLEKLSEGWPEELIDLETQQIDKIGPLSIQAPLADRMSQIQGYWAKPDFYPDDFAIEEAFKRTLYETGLHIPLLRTRSAEHAAFEMENQTNSGLPNFTRRILARSDDIKRSINGEYSDFPAVLGWRGQSSGINELPKQRTVWMFPQSANISEARMFAPLHAKMKDLRFASAWIGPDRVDESVTVLLRSGKEIYSTDFSSYDQSLFPDLLHYYFDLCKSGFQPREREFINDLEYYINHIELLISDSILLTGTHGMPSGSNLTNQADTLIHRLAQHYVSIRVSGSLHPYSQVQGDDGLLLIENPKAKAPIQAFFSELGLEFNHDKTLFSSEYVHYLQRLHTKNWAVDGKFVGIYPFSRALNSLLGMERWRNKEEFPPEFYSLRAIMILENCKHHPSFGDVVRFVVQGDRFGLGLYYPGGIDRLISPKNVVSYVNLPGAYPTYNMERVGLDGIGSFKTVQLLKSI